MDGDEEPISIDTSSEDVKDKKSRKKKKEGAAKGKKKQVRDSCDEPISEADCQDSHRTVENGIIHKPLQSSPSLIPSKFDESEQNGTHTSEPQVTTPMSELEPSGPKISQSESLVIGTETSESKKQSHVALLVNPIKGIA